MELSHQDRRHLEYSRGYMVLGMLDDATSELNRISPEHFADPEILEVRLKIHAKAKRWPNAVDVARYLAKVQPSNPARFIQLASAVRHAVCTESAREILVDAKKRFPNNPAIQYNLGCYAAQLGDLESARSYVRRAIELDPSFQTRALEDPDLEPIRPSLKSEIE
jgi:Flp pilus assembly protein TadD